MNKHLEKILIAIAILALIGGIFLVGSMYVRLFSIAGTNAGINSWNQNNEYGFGMMNGRGGPGMMNGYGYNQTSLTPLTVEQAKNAAQKYLTNTNNPYLQIAEVMIFDNNAYVAVKETSTGNGAFELLVDPSSQIAYPEYGPNMMWNQKYGMMGGHGGMMNSYQWNNSGSQPSTEMTVTPEQAIQIAQKFLDTNISGATAATDPMRFYGYYTLDFEKDGKVAGMLSVNGYSGQVFLHTWHGTFIEEASLQ